MMSLMCTTLQPAEIWLDLFVGARPWKHGATDRLLQGCVVLSYPFDSQDVDSCCHSTAV